MSQDIRRRRFIRSSAVVGTAVLAGCTGSSGNGSGGGGGNGSDGGNGSGGGGNGSGGSGSSSSPPTIALSIPSLEFTFFARMQNAFKQAKNKGMISSNSSFYDAGNSQSTQVSNVETAVTNNVDFLMISPITAEGIINAIKKANKNGIPVIAIDRNIAKGKTVTYIASDNVQLGKRSTELCLNFMKENTNKDTYNIVQLEGTPGASVTNDRGKGFQNVVSNNNNLKKLASQTGEFSTQNALSVMEDFITQYGSNIDGVFCQNDLMALGVHQAQQGSNISVPITGIDGTEAWVKRFSGNQYYGTIAQLPEKMVTTGIKKGKAHLAGENVKDTIPIKGLKVTQENASDYLSQYFG